jgi:hypothetical protein
MSARRHLALPLLGVALIASGCGSSSESKTSAKTALRGKPANLPSVRRRPIANAAPQAEMAAAAPAAAA